jgi:hypothetical protein
MCYAIDFTATVINKVRANLCYIIRHFLNLLVHRLLSFHFSFSLAYFLNSVKTFLRPPWQKKSKGGKRSTLAV